MTRVVSGIRGLPLYEMINISSTLCVTHGKMQINHTDLQNTRKNLICVMLKPDF